jgi:sugar transferase (PEP-CTERM system associated)
VYSLGIVCIGVGVLTYAFPSLWMERKIFYLTILFVAFLLLMWRLSFDYYLQHNAVRDKILVVGNGVVAKMIGEEIRKHERLGFQLMGFVSGFPQTAAGLDEVGKTLGDFSDIPEILKSNRVAKVIVALNERRGEYPVSTLLDLRVRGYDVVEWPVFFEKLSGRIPIDNLAPSHFIFQDGFRKSWFLLTSRRVISLLVSVTMLLLLSPLMLLVALLVKLDSSGSVFYSQDRVGLHGKVFRIFKFRSMRQDAEASVGPTWACEDDPRITRVGRLIRRVRIDELPQLLNILKGDINIVGPRPERPEFVEKLDATIPYYSLRHTVRPGLTGWAQVMYPYGATIEESKEKLQYDLFYLKNMSLKLDLLVLFRTIKIVLLGTGAR